MLALLSAMLSVPAKTAPATVLVSKDHSSSGSPPALAPSLQLDTVVPDASFAWTTFSSGADCEANGCITPSSQAECEGAMRALTTRSTLQTFRGYHYARCVTQADSSTPASNTTTSYNLGYSTNLGATTCGYGTGWNCACKCPPPDMCECTGDGNQISCRAHPAVARYGCSGPKCLFRVYVGARSVTRVPHTPFCMYRSFGKAMI